MDPIQPKKGKLIDRLAAENGVAIVVVDESSKVELSANNNSMCQLLMASSDFSSSCAEYCGKAFERAAAAGKTIEYECYAGLTCRAVPVAERGRRYAAIVGRIFLKADNYRKATEKAISGSWQRFKPTEFFANILISGNTSGLEKAVKRIEGIAAKHKEDVLQLDAPPVTPDVVPPTVVSKPKTVLPPERSAVTEKREPSAKTLTSAAAGSESEEIAEWRSLFGSLMKKDYRSACETFLEYIGERYKLDSLIWFDRKNGKFNPAAARGRLAGRTVRLGIDLDSQRIRDAAAAERPFVLAERSTTAGSDKKRFLTIFPVTVGGEIRGAIGIDGPVPSESIRARIVRAAQNVAPQLEILRLRDEVSQHDWLSKAVRRFNESLKRIDSDDFWTHVTQVSAELLQAERASLLVSTEDTRELLARAAIGARVNLFSAANVGNRVSRSALESGSPLLVTDMLKAGYDLAPNDWSYRTSSFISYPILIGDRRLAVMNFTDKATGGVFGERDLELLQAIAPQIAVAIDRTVLKHKAGAFEQLSVTDVLTGLLNRRYLQERLLEELSRSKRYRYPMSLLMLDVDKFKSYNDMFGHPAGDEALKLVSNILKENLRGADVAARYGGEEFAVLLPQTSVDEAGQIAERIRKQVERTQFPHRSVTVSIGLANVTAEINSPDDLIWAADRALYEAKDMGRNNVRVFDGDGDPLVNNVH